MSRKQYVVEAKYWDPIGAQEETYYGASELGFTTVPSDTPADTVVEPDVIQAASLNQSIIASGRTSGGSIVGSGDVVLNNNDGRLEWMGEKYWDGRRIKIWLKDVDGLLADAELIFAGTMRRLTVDWKTVSIDLKDLQEDLRTQAQRRLYAGDNSLPAGVEGTENDLKNLRKPLCLGYVNNVSPFIVNTSKLIYQVHDGSIRSISDVYDQGVALTASGTDHATQAALEAATPAAGQYDTCLTLGMFVLGTAPTGEVTVDVYGQITGNIGSDTDTCDGTNWSSTNATVTERDVLGPDNFWYASEYLFTGTGDITHDFTTAAAIPYYASFWIKIDTAKTVRIRVETDPGATLLEQDDFEIKTEYTRIGIAFTPTSGAAHRIVIGHSGGTQFVNGESVHIYGMQVEPGYRATAYVPNERELATYTEEIDNAAWSKTGVTITANNAVSPEWQSLADTLVEDVGATEHKVNLSNLNRLEGRYAYTFRAMVKANGRDQVRLMVTDGSDIVEAKFDITGTGTVDSVSTTPTNYQINHREALIYGQADDWYLICLNFTWATTTGTNVAFHIGCLDSGGNASYTGDGASGIHLCGVSIQPIGMNLIPQPEDPSGAQWTLTNLTATTESLLMPDRRSLAPKLEQTIATSNSLKTTVGYNGSTFYTQQHINTTSIAAFSGYDSGFEDQNVTGITDDEDDAVGSTTMDRITASGSGSISHYIRARRTGIANPYDWTVSIEVKAGTATKVRLLSREDTTGAGAYIDVNVSTGALIQTGTQSGGTLNGYGIEYLGESVYRLWVSARYTSTNPGTMEVYVLDSDGNSAYEQSGEYLYVDKPVQHNGTTAYPYVAAAGSAVTAVLATSIVRMKAGETQAFRLLQDNGTEVWYEVDLATATLTKNTSHFQNVTLTLLNNGWYEISCLMSLLTGLDTVDMGVYIAKDVDSFGSAGVTGSGMYFGGMNLFFHQEQRAWEESNNRGYFYFKQSAAGMVEKYYSSPMDLFMFSFCLSPTLCSLGNINLKSMMETWEQTLDPVGVYIKEEEITTVLDLVASSRGIWYYPNKIERFLFRLLEAPAATALVTLKKFDRDMLAIETDIDIQSLTRRPSNDNLGIPAYRVTVSYDKNQTIQTRDVLAGAVTDARKAYLAQQFRNITDEDLTILDVHPLAGEILIESPTPSVSSATRESNRLQTLYGSQRDIFEITAIATTEDPVLLTLGDTVQISVTRPNGSISKYCRIVSSRWNLRRNKVELVLWG